MVQPPASIYPQEISGRKYQSPRGSTAQQLKHWVDWQPFSVLEPLKCFPRPRVEALFPLGLIFLQFEFFLVRAGISCSNTSSFGVPLRRVPPVSAVNDLRDVAA